jgi:hypothetical protein
LLAEKETKKSSRKINVIPPWWGISFEAGKYKNNPGIIFLHNSNISCATLA